MVYILHNHVVMPIVRYSSEWNICSSFNDYLLTLNLMGSNQNIYIPKNFVLYNNINNIVNNVTVLVHVVLCSIISISRQ